MKDDKERTLKIPLMMINNLNSIFANFFNGIDNYLAQEGIVIYNIDSYLNQGLLPHRLFANLIYNRILVTQDLMLNIAHPFSVKLAVIKMQELEELDHWCTRHEIPNYEYVSYFIYLTEISHITSKLIADGYYYIANYLIESEISVVKSQGKRRLTEEERKAMAMLHHKRCQHAIKFKRKEGALFMRTLDTFAIADKLSNDYKMPIYKLGTIFNCSSSSIYGCLHNKAFSTKIISQLVNMGYIEYSQIPESISKYLKIADNIKEEYQEYKATIKRRSKLINKVRTGNSKTNKKLIKTNISEDDDEPDEDIEIDEESW